MTLLPLPEKIIICGAGAEGNTKLNAFDNALAGMGIGDCNIITVSSIIPQNAVVTRDITELKDIPSGSLLPVVMAKITSQSMGKIISSSLAYWKIEKQTGYIAEHHEICKKKQCEEMAKQKLHEMLKNRRIDFRDSEIMSVSIQHEVKKCVCTLCVAIYL